MGDDNRTELHIRGFGPHYGSIGRGLQFEYSVPIARQHGTLNRNFQFFTEVVPRKLFRADEDARTGFFGILYAENSARQVCSNGSRIDYCADLFVLRNGIFGSSDRQVRSQRAQFSNRQIGAVSGLLHENRQSLRRIVGRANRHFRVSNSRGIGHKRKNNVGISQTCFRGNGKPLSVFVFDDDLPIAVGFKSDREIRLHGRGGNLRLIGPKRRIRKIDILIYACCGQYRYEKQCEKPPGI